MPHLLRDRRLLQDNQPPEIIDGYLLNDTFTTDRAAGAVDGTAAEPGPGRRAATDGNSKLTLSGGLASFATAGVSAGNPGIWYGTNYPRIAGQLCVARETHTSSGVEIGFDANLSGALTDSVRPNGTTLAVRANVTAIDVGVIATGTAYQYAIVQRAEGNLYFVKGGDFANWTLIWVSASSTAKNPALSVINASTVATLDYYRISAARWLPAPLASDSFTVWGATDGAGHAEGVVGGLGAGGGGLSWAQNIGMWQASGGAASASALSAGVAVATVDTGKGDVVATAKITRTAGVAGVVVRRADASNHVRAVHDGANALLIKRVGGTETTVITAAATYVAGAEIRVICEATSFRVFYNNAAVGSAATISDAGVQSGTMQGLFTTDTANAMDDFVVYARGSGGEHAPLDAF